MAGDPFSFEVGRSCGLVRSRTTLKVPMPKLLFTTTVIEHARPGFDLAITTDESNVIQLNWTPHRDDYLEEP